MKRGLLQSYLQRHTPACGESLREEDMLQLQPSNSKQPGCETVLTLAKHWASPASHTPQGNGSICPSEAEKWVKAGRDKSVYSEEDTKQTVSCVKPPVSTEHSGNKQV